MARRKPPFANPRQMALIYLRYSFLNTLPLSIYGTPDYLKKTESCILERENIKGTKIGIR